MTPREHAEVIHAFANGAEIQCQNHCEKVWRDIKEPSFLDSVDYRVKPTPKMAWYRVAETKHGTCTANMKRSEGEIDQAPYFIRWLTDRIEYEVTE